MVEAGAYTVPTNAVRRLEDRVVSRPLAPRAVESRKVVVLERRSFETSEIASLPVAVTRCGVGSQDFLDEAEGEAA